MTDKQTGVIATIIASHTPRMAIEEKAWDFTTGLIQGLRDMGKAAKALKPDLFVVNTTHWITTFDWVFTAHQQNKGVCIAEEAPHLVPGVPYDYKGDPEFSKAAETALRDNDIPCYADANKYFHWDYGTLVPIQYMDPEQEVPVVTTPTCYMSDLKENERVGELIDEVAQAQGKRVIVVVSNALTHQLVRKPDAWPLEEHQKMDFKFIDMVKDGDIDGALDYLPKYAVEAKCEMGGRGLGVFLGASHKLQEHAGKLHGEQFGPYSQSSGSGNVNLLVTPNGAA